MSRTSAARRASCASSFEQQPRDPVRKVAGDWDSARCTPVTSCPASTASAAATAESTPPDLAARTLLAGRSSAYEPSPVDDGGQRLNQRIDIGSGRGVT